MAKISVLVALFMFACAKPESKLEIKKKSIQSSISRLFKSNQINVSDLSTAQETLEKLLSSGDTIGLQTFEDSLNDGTWAAQSSHAQNVSGKVDLIINIKSINQKTLAEVEKVLGKAEDKEKVKGYPCERSNCQRAYFKEGDYEIIFKGNKADRITIYSVPNLTGKDNAILALGLPDSKPTFRNTNNVLRYNNIAGITEISFFPNYVLIQISKPD